GHERSSIGVSDLRLFWELPRNFAIFMRDVKEGSFTRISRLLIFFSLRLLSLRSSIKNNYYLSDFGLAKWLPDLWTHHTVSKVEGTFGYLIPGFFMHGIVDEKTDVYAYGVLLLELITGRQALDSSQKSLIMWAMINDIFAHRKPARVFESVFYCMLLPSYATLAIGTEWIFRPKQEVISLVLCSCDVLLLLLT
ncbi:hypothetical protein S83_001591, partial [Arachis hypogaea]